MLTALILALVVALVAFVAYRVVRSYRAATGTTWGRLVAAAQESATVLWAYVVGLSGTLLAWTDQAAAFLNLPEVQAFLKTHLTPTRVGIALTVISVVTIAARLRTLMKGD